MCSYLRPRSSVTTAQTCIFLECCRDKRGSNFDAPVGTYTPSSVGTLRRIPRRQYTDLSRGLISCSTKRTLFKAVPALSVLLLGESASTRHFLHRLFHHPSSRFWLVGRDGWFLNAFWGCQLKHIKRKKIGWWSIQGTMHQICEEQDNGRRRTCMTLLALCRGWLESRLHSWQQLQELNGLGLTIGFTLDARCTVY